MDIEKLQLDIRCGSVILVVAMFASFLGISASRIEAAVPDPELNIQVGNGAKSPFKLGDKIDLAELEYLLDSTAVKLYPSDQIKPVENRGSDAVLVKNRPDASLLGATAESVFRELAREAVSHLEVERGTSFTLSWPEAQPAPVIVYYDFFDEYAFSSTSDEKVSEPNNIRRIRRGCGFIPVNQSEHQVLIDPASLNCQGGTLDKGILFSVEVERGGKISFGYVYMENKKTPNFGSDIGVALTLINRWDEGGGSSDGDPSNEEGFRSNTAGAGFYYSLSDLRNKRFRPLFNVLVLDMDPEIDFELGLGFGGLFKIQPDQETQVGFGIAGGIGYNLMVDEEDEAWYTFVGFTANFNTN